MAFPHTVYPSSQCHAMWVWKEWVTLTVCVCVRTQELWTVGVGPKGGGVNDKFGEQVLNPRPAPLDFPRNRPWKEARNRKAWKGQGVSNVCERPEANQDLAPYRAKFVELQDKDCVFQGSNAGGNSRALLGRWQRTTLRKAWDKNLERTQRTLTAEYCQSVPSYNERKNFVVVA